MTNSRGVVLRVEHGHGAVVVVTVGSRDARAVRLEVDRVVLVVEPLAHVLREHILFINLLRELSCFLLSMNEN